MIDPIKLAQQKAKLSDTIKTAETLKNKVVADKAKQALGNLKVPEKIPTSLEDLKGMVPELPIQPDPELLKKEAMARAQTLRADAEKLVQQRIEQELGKTRDAIETAGKLAALAVGFYFKAPLLDPKYLAYIAYMKAKEKLRELKQKASKENLKKSKEAFTFPMKPPRRIDLSELPKIPDIPKIPEIPKVNLPKLPKFP